MKKFKVTMVDTTTRVGTFEGGSRFDAEKAAYNSDQQDRKVWKVDGANTQARIKKVEEVEVKEEK